MTCLLAALNCKAGLKSVILACLECDLFFYCIDNVQAQKQKQAARKEMLASIKKVVDTVFVTVVTLL